jgi:NAD-dependent dihydropyrimidine dehydrogenase PreA subunit
MAYVIAEPCIDVCSQSCTDVCPVDCIYEVERMFAIHPRECIDCGACVPECPVEAIYPQPELPPEQLPFVAINAAIQEGAAAVDALVEARTAAFPPPPIPGHRD